MNIALIQTVNTGLKFGPFVMLPLLCSLFDSTMTVQSMRSSGLNQVLPDCSVIFSLLPVTFCMQCSSESGFFSLSFNRGQGLPSVITSTK